MRRIPIDFPPLPGESLDSWLLGYAARLHTELEDLTEALGIGSMFMGQPAAVVALGRRVPDLGRLVEATGLPADAVEALWRPLSRYSLVAGRRFGQRRMARAARPMLWTRFCPPCLAESGGRWAAAWRLPWFVACPVHLRLLASACPVCGKHQRQSTLRYDLEPEPANCSALRAGVNGRGEHRCGAPLTSGPPESDLPPLAMAAQSRLIAILDPWATDELLASSIEVLADLLTVASLTGLDFDILHRRPARHQPRPSPAHRPAKPRPVRP